MNTAILAFMFAQASQTFNLPPKLLESVCFIETRHDITAVHEDDGGANSVGVCQVKLTTARWLGFKGTEIGLLDPKVNIYFAAKYLKYQHTRYKNIQRALVAYNRGNAKDLMTTQYSDKVIKHWRANVDEERNKRSPAGS